ncbi:universal stress protein [Rasiella sp. SM2506]|uniref:universal stress protein n=1 Tax=Rasiella sp. SM2506 TaxID=3423914 RepID=UPI003D7B7292
MKKILIPIDFKFNSYDAIDYAINFFKREQCDFYFLNTYSYNTEGLNAIHLLQADKYWFEKPKQDSEKNLGNLIQKYTYTNLDKKHYFNALSECTDLVEGIKKTIKEIEIDLVVLPGKEDSNDTTEKYSKNTKRIIENIRGCPVMVIPFSAKLHKNPEFVLVSNFEEELPTAELRNWYELVKIAKGTIKIVTLSGKDSMSTTQKENQKRVRFEIEGYFKSQITIEYIETIRDLKDFANDHSDYIICLMDRKPDFWRICGITHSQVTNLGPLRNTPLIALHH